MTVQLGFIFTLLLCRIFQRCGVPAKRRPHADDRPVFAQFAGHGPATVLRAARRVQHAVAPKSPAPAAAPRWKGDGRSCSTSRTRWSRSRRAANGLDVPVTAKLHVPGWARAASSACGCRRRARRRSASTGGTSRASRRRAPPTGRRSRRSCPSSTCRSCRGGMASTPTSKCLDATGAAAVMSSEALLENPRSSSATATATARTSTRTSWRGGTSTRRRSTRRGRGSRSSGPPLKVVHNELRRHALRDILDARDLAAVRDVVVIATPAEQQTSLPAGLPPECRYHRRHRRGRRRAARGGARRRPPPSREEAESAALERRERKARKRAASSGSRARAGAGRAGGGAGASVLHVHGSRIIIRVLRSRAQGKDRD